MNYTIKEITIRDLYKLVESDKIDLNPSYQRNFIWSPNDQRDLIDTIIKGYPLPNFFLYLLPNGSFEMVDGQQRTKTIYRFIKGDLTSSQKTGKLKFVNINQDLFLNYRIPVVIINDLNANDSLNEFYVLINKKGVHLNSAEVNKSEFLDTNFLKLSNELLSYQPLINLDLFSEATSKRMNDRAFVEELVGYLLLGLKDKRKSVDETFETDITMQEYQNLDDKFKRVIDKIETFNEIKPISKTRYKQKNDFYTLFCFVSENLYQEDEIFKQQYHSLIILDGKDKEGRQLIRPSNEECFPLRDYANNCITQSNSKKSRENRLNFFNSVLKNKSLANNEVLKEILSYFSTIYEDKQVYLKKIGDYELLSTDLI